MIVCSNLDYYLIFIQTDNLNEFSFHWCVPLIVKMIASASIDVVRDDELSFSVFGKLELRLEPVELILGDRTLWHHVVVYHIIH